MKKIISLILVLIVTLSTIPSFAFASSAITQGEYKVTGNIKGDSGSFDILVKPANDCQITAMVFSYTLPNSFVSTNSAKTSLGSNWSIKSYGNRVSFSSLNNTSIQSAGKPDNDGFYNVCTVYIKPQTGAKIEPGTKYMKIKLESAAKINENAEFGFDDATQHFDIKSSQSSYPLVYAIDIKNAKITGLQNLEYSGKPKKQYVDDVEVRLNGNLLTVGKDYKISYKNNIESGVATLVVTGTGAYYGTANKAFIIYPQNLQTLTKTSVTISSISMKWNKCVSATGYLIYRSKSENSGYSLIKTIPNLSTTTFTDNTVFSGIKYFYRVYVYKQVGSEKYLSEPRKVGITTSGFKVNVVSGFKAKNITKKSLKLSWKNVNFANGYFIYRSTKKNSGYKLIKTINDRYTTSFKNTGLKAGTKYFYRISAYRLYNSQKCIGEYALSSPITKFNAVKISKLASPSSKKVKLTYKKPKNTKGIEIYYSLKKSKGYKKLYMGTKTTIKKGGLKSKKKYFFKIRPYNVCDGVTYYGSYSGVKSIKIK